MAKCRLTGGENKPLFIAVLVSLGMSPAIAPSSSTVRFDKCASFLTLSTPHPGMIPACRYRLKISGATIESKGCSLLCRWLMVRFTQFLSGLFSHRQPLLSSRAPLEGFGAGNLAVKPHFQHPRPSLLFAEFASRELTVGEHPNALALCPAADCWGCPAPLPRSSSFRRRLRLRRSPSYLPRQYRRLSGCSHLPRCQS